MRKYKLQREGATATKIVQEPVIVDYDGEEILAMEIIGYSEISGRLPDEAELRWLTEKVIAVGCDREDDVLTVEVAHGINSGQREVGAAFGFDADGKLVSLTFPAD